MHFWGNLLHGMLNLYLLIFQPKRLVTAQGKPWHPEHFCCTECGIQLDPNKFWEKEGLPYCEDDYHKLVNCTSS